MKLPDIQSWKTLSKRTLLKHGKYLTVESHTVELPDGRIIPDWPWVISPDFIIVQAITLEGKFLCFHQTKYGVDGTTLAPVGGYIEPSENPLEAAKRELKEETGHVADDWVSLGTYRVGGNRGFGMAHLFMARGSRRVTQPVTDDLEEQHILHLSRSEMEKALTDGKFRVLAWAAAAALALRKSSEKATA